MQTAEKITAKNTTGLIQIIGARQHNLKNISVSIPENKLTVITGVSGSGKTSLAFDTLYAEGQRKYIESLSSYIRQFLGKIEKPKVDKIINLSPTIAIQQKKISGNPRSTVGTVTEIYDYLKLLFARIGEIYSPVSGKKVIKQTTDHVWQFIHNLPQGTKCMLLAPIVFENEKDLSRQLKLLMEAGYNRILINGQVEKIELFSTYPVEKIESLYLIIDRFAVNNEDDDLKSRIYESVETAFFEGRGSCALQYFTDEQTHFETFHNRLTADGIEFEEPDVHFFAFNNPHGACKTCEGFGSVLGIDEDLVVPDKNLSVYEDAIVCWKGEKMSEFKDMLIHLAHQYNFPVHTPYKKLTPEQKKFLWEGAGPFPGINGFFKMLEENSYKIQYRVMLARYRGKTVCPDCKGTRIRPDAAWVKINGKSIIDLVLMPIDELKSFFDNIKLTEQQNKIAQRILLEIHSRLTYMQNTGLGYLTLNRASNSLSGGESQRMYLATILGSTLTGSIYILDEPSIGLHARDTHRLIKVLKELKELGNTVVVIEHDEDIIQAADYIIDIGPGAGINGGEVVFQGEKDLFLKESNGLTAKYIRGDIPMTARNKKQSFHKKIVIEDCHGHNLKNLSLEIPLQCIVCFTGVSGSGKSSLVTQTLYPALMREIMGHSPEKPLPYGKIYGHFNEIQNIELIDQNPLGKSSRSNPATYLKVWDDIRELMAKQPLAKRYGLKPSSFSFNVAGGRCEECKGEGEITVDMQFMGDVRLVCEACGGKRFQEQVLEVTYKGLNVDDLLTKSIEEVFDFFNQEPDKHKKLLDKLKALMDVGLGYMPLGQSSSTISGGEAQRIKLASYLVKSGPSKKTLFIFDEPTTGLHFHDVNILIHAMGKLIDEGHSIWMIEHHPDMIKSADYIIDLGPEGGEKGGEIIFQGKMDDFFNCKRSYTSQFLNKKTL